jgi:Tfp pilus assembly protein FimV
MMQRKQLPLMLALAWGAQAAELGDIAPRSYIGQPLAVDIELVALTPEEAPACRCGWRRPMCTGAPMRP